MQIIDNINKTVKDDLQVGIHKGSKMSVAAACFSIYAYQELKKQLEGIDELRFIFTSPTFVTEKTSKAQREFYIPRISRESSLYGTEFEVKLRNELTQKAIAKECADWIRRKAVFKSNVTQEQMMGFMTVDESSYMPINGFTTVDLGCERGNNAYYPVQKTESFENANYFLGLFEQLWNDKKKLQEVTDIVIENISAAYRENAPEYIYFVALYNIFKEFLDDVSEDELPNEATGFKESKIWGMLYNFQRDAVLAIISKLEKFNGCILADSVGLGKTFTALAVIKYYENRNKSVLVLCPKKLSENWNTYKGNYINNPIAADRLRYDVLYHTDLSREHGQSNGIDLDRLNWGNYDLVVIDPFNGIYADMFEEEYNDILSSMQREIGDEDYIRYLDAITAHDTHAGYFSVDKKGKMTDSKLSDKKEGTSDDIDAYDLIMKNKELLLDRDPKKSPVRFIFSHSALREGWDNPNVFQICTLKQSGSEVRKRQEVGRGLRLCVNQDGERMDANVLGNDVHSINVLTVIASESYDSFAKGLQTEIADAVAGRPVAVTADLFKGKVIVDARGNEQVVDGETAQAIYFDLIVNGYVDKKGALTDKYYADKANGTIQVAEEVADSRDAVINILDSVYDSRAMQPENARDKNVELQVDRDKLAMPEFKELWKRISPKSVYVVDFDTDELVDKTIASINRNLHVSKIYFKVETGAMDEIKSKDALLDGSAFSKSKSSTYDSSKQIRTNSSVKYDLVGKLVVETGLTRKAVVAILTGIEKTVFEQFKFNPEEFIIKTAALINDEKATAIIQHITYNVLDEQYDTDIFTEPTIRGKLGTNAMKAQRHLYDHIVYDSTNERDFATDLDTNTDVAVYVKLPDSFYIATPVGHYNPDWAIAFYEGTVKHIYFVAETKGSMSSMQLRLIEESKIHCAREHFKAISNGNVVYDVVDSYQTLLEKVMK